LDSKIWESIHGFAMVECWVQKGWFTGDAYHDVNWEACKKVMKSLNLVCQHWVAKHVSGHAGVGVKMVEWKMRETEECPRCSEVEDTRHVWTCQAAEARILHSQHFYKL
jgi:hypothetical protein